jgi:class 3 adenylate cyclase
VGVEESTGRNRSFSRITPEADRAEIIAELTARGVPREWMEDEPDLTGLAADVNLRGVDRISPREAADRADLSLEDARRVWLCLGVAVSDDEAPVFTEAEAEVLLFYANARDLFGEPVVLQVLRVMGSAITRMAEAEVGALRLAYEIPFVESGATDLELVDGYDRLTRMILPEVESAFAAVHRLLLARASRRAWATDGDGTATLAEVAVGFADLTDFTELSARLTAGELAEAVDTFDERVGDLVTGHGGQVVKLIGDEVMFVADDLDDGLAVARAISGQLAVDHRLPAVRVGLACGEVVSRDGDYYGSVVNLAARLVTLAEPGDVLVSAVVAASLDGAAVEALAPVDVKGFADPVAAYRLRA